MTPGPDQPAYSSCPFCDGRYRQQPRPRLGPEAYACTGCGVVYEWADAGHPRRLDTASDPN